MGGEPKAIEATLRAYVHATEDEDKVLGCFGTLLPYDISSEIRKTSAQGTFKNPISILEAKARGRKLKDFLAHIGGSFSPSDRKQLRQEIVERFSEGKLFLRFDKMKAYEGEVSLGDGITLEITLTSYPYNEEAINSRLKEGWPFEVC